jgi:hypothetical protein
MLRPLTRSALGACRVAGGQGMHADMTLGRLKPLWPVLSPWQRSCLGFPREGADYWTAATVKAVGERYPELDMTPYAKL